MVAGVMEIYNGLPFPTVAEKGHLLRVATNA